MYCMNRGCTLRITNIPWDMTLQSLREQMADYGKITNWIAHRDKLCAYVTYESSEVASHALQTMREHRRLVLEFANISLEDTHSRNNVRQT